MNCIDVHRKLTTDANDLSDAVSSHLEECPSCAKFLESIRGFDKSLHSAANINIPEGLAERILLKQSFVQQHQERSNRYRFIAVAASLLLVLGVSFNIGTISNVLDKNLSLEEVAINHVIDELGHFDENKNIQLAKLNKVLQPFNIKLNNSIGTVRYAGTCPIRNSRGVHLVIENNNETATLLVMPGEYIKERKSHTKGQFTTTIIPAQNGSIAIVTKTETNSAITKALEKSFNNAIQYI